MVLGAYDFCRNGSSLRNTIVACWLEMHPFIKLRAMSVAIIHSASSSLHSSWHATRNTLASVASLMFVGWDNMACALMNKLRYSVSLHRSKRRYLGCKRFSGQAARMRARLYWKIWRTHTPHLTKVCISCWRICSKRCNAPLMQAVSIGWYTCKSKEGRWWL